MQFSKFGQSCSYLHYHLKEEGGEEVKLSPKQTADLERTKAECGKELDEVPEAVQNLVWEQYARDELSIMFLDVEAACDSAQSVHIKLKAKIPEFLTMGRI